MFQDKLGYLWIGTENGVVQYNGYESKVYNVSNGLIDDDVWDFYEDKKGRIWLSRISGELGYIYNEEYHKVHVNNCPISTFYPKYIREHETGIMFVTVEAGIYYLVTEQNDSLHFDELAIWDRPSEACITKDGTILYCTKEVIYEAIREKNGKLKLIEKCRNNRYPERGLLRNLIMPKSGLFLDRLFALNVKNCREVELEFEGNDRIYNQYENGQDNYIITDQRVYILDKNLKYSRSYPLSDYVPNTIQPNYRVAYIMEDSFWSDCIATKKSGMFFRFEMPYFRHHDISNMAKFKLVVNGTDNLTYWWNNESKILKYSYNNIEYKEKKYSEIGNIEGITPYTSTESLLYTQGDIYILNKKTMELTSFSERARHYTYNSINPLLSKHIDLSGDNKYMTESTLRILPDKNGGLHCVTRGYGYVYIKYSGDTLICNELDAGRFNDIAYDSLNNAYILYNGTNILINSKNTISKVPKDILEKNNISRIEKIIIDKNGDALIKDYDKIVRYNIYNRKFEELLNQQKLKKAIMYLHNDVLIVAGKFGVQFSKINTENATTQNILYPNTKNLAYNVVFNISINGNIATLVTDSGHISISIPHDSFYYNKSINTEPAYRFILKHKNKHRSIQSFDTVLIDQQDRSLQFGIINPSGIGQVTFQSLIEGIDTTWNVWNANEIHLSKIETGKYYTINVKAIDEVSENNLNSIVIYIIPTFWQTEAGRFVFWLCICILSFVVVIATAYYTVKVVSKKNAEKNYLLSLELKVIYSQINPHFIFNTLNTSLYYISENKNEDAYRHISTFSELLRSYIRSARNKYISLSEEIENLENYIQLYQSRYENKFIYSIKVDESLDLNARIIPALLFQPFVENAINHGLLHKEEQGLLTLSFLRRDDHIVCTIDDNGIGREKSAQLKEEKGRSEASYGNELIKELIDIINTENTVKIEIEYVDKSPPLTGTKVIITIKTKSHGKQI